jgi:hypothetical protein
MSEIKTKIDIASVLESVFDDFGFASLMPVNNHKKDIIDDHMDDLDVYDTLKQVEDRIYDLFNRIVDLHEIWNESDWTIQDLINAIDKKVNI